MHAHDMGAPPGWQDKIPSFYVNFVFTQGNVATRYRTPEGDILPATIFLLDKTAILVVPLCTCSFLGRYHTQERVCTLPMGTIGAFSCRKQGS